MRPARIRPSVCGKFKQRGGRCTSYTFIRSLHHHHQLLFSSSFSSSSSLSLSPPTSLFPHLSSFWVFCYLPLLTNHLQPPPSSPSHPLIERHRPRIHPGRGGRCIPSSYLPTLIAQAPEPRICPFPPILLAEVTYALCAGGVVEG